VDSELFQKIVAGSIFSLAGEAKVGDLAWHEHPTFPGVALKHLVTAASTDGKFSSHLVWVKESHEIGEHVHQGKWEMHEIIQGQGECQIDGKQVDYFAGVSAVIPADLPHSVKAVGNDLYILAKFIPALL